jgi:hypothetical protein
MSSFEGWLDTREARPDGSGLNQPRPALGLVPWLAGLRRAFVRRLLVRFDIGAKS